MMRLMLKFKYMVSPNDYEGMTFDLQEKNFGFRFRGTGAPTIIKVHFDDIHKFVRSHIGPEQGGGTPIIGGLRRKFGYVELQPWCLLPARELKKATRLFHENVTVPGMMSQNIR